MKVLVLGAGGMAGHVVSLFLRENGFNVDTLSAKHALDQNTKLVDVTDRGKFEDVLKSDQYDAVINCIGILVKQSEDRKDLSTFINAYLPHFLEKFYENSPTKVIHISSDCVFSGKNPPYRENSPHDGESFYDRTKSLGEIINAKDLTFRMSIIGPDMKKEGAGLFNWFYKQDGEISGYTHSMWSGITTLELAKGIKAAIEQNLTGLYHLVPENNISKYDLLVLLKEVFNLKKIEIKPVEGLVVDRTLINTRKDFHHQVPDYKTTIHDMRVWIENHPKIYEHYAD